MTWYSSKYQVFPTQKRIELDISKPIVVFGWFILHQTQIITTNLINNYSINDILNHFIHHYFPILIKHYQWSHWYITLHYLVFDTIYCNWFEFRFKIFYNLLSMSYMFLMHCMCHISNMKLINFFLPDWVPFFYHVSQWKLILMFCY